MKWNIQVITAMMMALGAGARPTAAGTGVVMPTFAAATTNYNAYQAPVASPQVAVAAPSAKAATTTTTAYAAPVAAPYQAPVTTVLMASSPQMQSSSISSSFNSPQSSFSMSSDQSVQFANTSPAASPGLNGFGTTSSFAMNQNSNQQSSSSSSSALNYGNVQTTSQSNQSSSMSSSTSSSFTSSSQMLSAAPQFATIKSNPVFLY